MESVRFSSFSANETYPNSDWLGSRVRLDVKGLRRRKDDRTAHQNRSPLSEGRPKCTVQRIKHLVCADLALQYKHFGGLVRVL